MRVKISISSANHAWYNREYLNGRTCEVLAIRDDKNSEPEKEYCVIHPITKKPGYYIPHSQCKVVEELPEPVSWEYFLEHNDYGWTKSY